MGALSGYAKLTVYPAPEKAPLNNTFSVEVRQCGAWQPVPVYNVRVDKVEEQHTVTDASMSFFDFSDTVEVRIISRRAKIDTARIRPLSYGIIPGISGDTIRFSLDRPRMLSVEINGDIFNNLHLFANPIDENRPSDIKKFIKGKNNIYFGPGYHKLDSALIVGSDKNVYIDGSAYIDGEIVIADAENVKVNGRGIIYPEKRIGIMVRNSKNVQVDGLFTTQCAVGGSDSVNISNVKVMSYYGWGDGFNVFASNNIHYNRVFARSSDDCSTVYATRKGFSGGARNITMENAVLWADVAHPIMIGIHGCVEKPDTIQNILYRNIDILDHMERQLDYQGVFTINSGDNNLIKDVTFEDIRVEDFRCGRLLDLRIFYNTKYCGAPGNSIENVNFNDIVYNGDNSEMSLIIGYDDIRKVKGVHFRNLTINGVKIHDKMPGKPGWYKTADMAKIFIGEHTEDITFE